MDFSSILKGASDTLKKLETDVTNAGKDMASDASGWQGWTAPGEDDGWEDVADVVPGRPPPPTPKAPPANLPLENGTVDDKELLLDGGDAKKEDAANGEDEAEAEKHGEGEQNGGTVDAKVALLQARLKEALDRVTISERKVYALTRDRDSLRRIRDSRTSDAELVKEKDKQIAAVMGEGEKLSIKIAEKEKVVRSLKGSLKDRDANVEDLRVTLSATEAKLEAANSRQRQLETSEKAAQDGMEAAERRLRQVESDARSKSSSSAALEAARAQLESLRKGQAAALENQAMRLRAEHETSLDQVTANAKTQEESLNKAMMELRAHLTQVVDNAGWREDQLRKETDELRKRAEQLEARNEELAAALPDATRPLLRQVEALQAAASERVRAKLAVDRSQLERLRAAETAVATAMEREKAAEDRIGNLMTRAATLEEQVKIAQGDQARVGAELRALQSENAEVQLRHQREMETTQGQILKANREKESALEDLSRERASHLDAIESADERERQLRSQIASLETRLEMVQESLTKATSMNAQRGSGPGPSISHSSPAIARFDSMGNVSSSSFGFAGSDFGEDSSPFADGTSPSAGVYATERLTQSLRQRSGEISSLQAQLDGKEAATKALAEEVVSLTARVEELTKEMSDAPGMKKEFTELKKRHTALLELLGEREERIMELQADLADVNQMYKEQITELLLRIEKMSS